MKWKPEKIMLNGEEIQFKNSKIISSKSITFDKKQQDELLANMPKT